MQSKTIQSTQPANAVFAELLGAGFILSFNYQRNFLFNERGHASARVGLGPAFEKEDAFVPISLFYNFGKEKSFLELGAGYTHRADPSETAMIHFICGYKRQVKNAFLFKAHLSPLYIIKTGPGDRRIFPWAGVSLGWAF